MEFQIDMQGILMRKNYWSYFQNEPKHMQFFFSNEMEKQCFFKTPKI